MRSRHLLDYGLLYYWDYEIRDTLGFFDSKILATDPIIRPHASPKPQKPQEE